jgi:biotin carboxyl carrier protein
MIYKAIINDDQEFAIEEADLEQIDFVEKNDRIFHLLISSKGHLIRLVHADYAKRTFHYEVDGHPICVQLKTPVEVQIDAMGYMSRAAIADEDIRAPMPGLVLDVRVKSGDHVKKGDPLIILEAMKMENVIIAAHDAVIDDVCVVNGQSVDKAEVLLHLTV